MPEAPQTEASENHDEDGFRKEGLPVDTIWHSHIAAGLPNWLDPKGNALGEGAKHFKYDPAAAKALLQAAGYNTPVANDYNYYTNFENPVQK